MLSSQITSTVTKKLKALQSLISEKYSEIRNLSQDELESIHRYARISMIGASTRIENAVLTDGEISWMDTVLTKDGKTTAFQDKRYLIEDKLSKDRERSIEEVAGCRAMLGLIYEQAKDMFPLTEIYVRGLHQELLKHYSEAKQYRGQYKKVPNSVVERDHATGRERDVFRTAEPGVVTNVAMADLVEWYNKALIDEPWSIVVACEFVFRFLAIHPFQDGNGRLGRGLFLLSLLQCPDDHVAFLTRYLAIDRQIEKHKEEYYQVLNRCSEGKYYSNPKKYHIEYFLDFMIKVLIRAIGDIEFYRRKYHAFQELSASALQVLACFQDEPETRLQTGDLVTKTNLPRRTVSNVLVILQKEGFLQKYGKARSVRYQIIF